MTFALVPVFYSLVAIASVWLVLLWCARVKPSRRSRRKIVIGAITASLLLVPFGELPLWNRAFSFFPNPSLPLLGIVCAALWQRLLGVAVFKPADWNAAWIFGAIAGTGLYLHPVMFGGVDLYYWGWDRESALAVLAVMAVVLLAWGSRLGVLLLAALIAFAVNTLESQNCWDYVMDPIYWFISVGMITKGIVIRVLGFRARAAMAGNSPDGVSAAEAGRRRDLQERI